MELREAIIRACRHTLQDKKGDWALRCVQFLPGCGEAPPRLFATDGAIYYLVDLPGHQFPAMVLPADLLARSARNMGAVEGFDPLADGGVAMHGWTPGRDERVAVTLARATGHAFPGMPAMPTEMTFCAQWPFIRRLLHIPVSKGPDSDRYGGISFAPDSVAAVSRARAAVSRIRGAWQGQVPVRLFPRSGGQDWPSYAFTWPWVWWRFGSELFFSRYEATPKWANLEGAVPEYHGGTWFVLPRVRFLDVVNQAEAASPSGAVGLEWDPAGLEVRTYSREGVGFGYRFAAPGRAGALYKVGRGQTLIAGAYLAQALKVAITPAVRCCVSGDGGPVRIESGVHTEVIWPLLVDRAVPAGGG